MPLNAASNMRVLLNLQSGEVQVAHRPDKNDYAVIRKSFSEEKREPFIVKAYFDYATAQQHALSLARYLQRDNEPFMEL